MKKWALRIGISIGLILLLVLSLAVALVTTPSGTRWLVNTAIEQSGQPLKFKNINGSLWSGLSIEHIEFENCGVLLTVQGLQYAWQPKLLLQHTLTVNELLANEIHVTPKADCEPVEKEPFVLPSAIKLPISIQLQRLYVQKIVLHNDTGSQSIDNVALQASVSPDQLELELQSLNYTTLSLQAQTVVQLQQPYPLQAAASWQYLLDEEKYQGEAQVKGDSAELAIDHQLKAPYQINTQLRLHHPLSEPEFASTSEWQRVEIVLNENESLLLRDGALIAHGNPATVDYQLTTQIDTAQAENIQVKAEGRFADKSVTLAPATLEHANANLTAAGKIDFAKNLAVQLNITAKNFNPGLWLADYPGDLAADIDLNFQQLPKAKKLDLQIRTLNGKLRGYPLQGSGHITSDLQQAKLDQVYLSVGDNSLRADGIVGEKIDVRASVSAARIDQLLAQAAGDVTGEIRLSGSLEKPQLKANLASKRLQFGEQFGWQQLDLNARVDGLEKPRVDVDMKVDAIQAGGQDLRGTKLMLSGIEAQHELQLSTDSSHGSLFLQANGSLQTEKLLWDGQIDQLQIKNTKAGDWQAPASVLITASPDQQEVTQLCLQQNSQQLCVDYQRIAEQQQTLVAQIKQFDFALLQPFIRQYATIEGLLDGQVDLRTDEKGLWIGDAALKTNTLKLVASEQTGLDESIQFEKLEITALLNDTSQLAATFESNRGYGNVDLGVTALQEASKAQITQGSVKLNIPQLTFLNPYLTGAVIKNGQVNVNLRLSGALQNPNISGLATIDELGFYLPTLGSEIDNGKIIITANNDAPLKIDGALFAKDAQLQLNGQLNLQKENFLAYQLHIKGQDFPLLDTVDYIADVSPDLTLQGDAKHLQFNGDILIPRLHIIVKELPKGIDSVSSDQVIVTANGDAVEQESLVVEGDVNVQIGNEATFTGYGLQTDLGGGLKVSLRQKKPPAGFGVLTMNNGQYRALGQALEIDKGEIIFSGPLDNPSLDIVIKRSSADVTVSLLLTGRADDPRSRLISDPVMSEANKLSYLLTGRAVDDLGSGEGTDLTAAAFALGLNKSSSVVQEIGTKFGLDTLSVQAGDDGMQSTSLLLGKHLSPRLYISYAKDLFSALGAIQLNYRLTDHLSIEAESGTTQTVDLIYSIATD